MRGSEGGRGGEGKEEGGREGERACPIYISVKTKDNFIASGGRL